jgi:uncharacterized protein YdhG (YjbR/CyaY superfamily)
MKSPATVEAYIASFPKEVQVKLRQLRRAILEAAPEARESISYRMPYYSCNGRLAYFSAFTNHIGLYIPTPVIEEHEKELKAYVTAKATVRFPIDKAIPLGLVKKLVRARLMLNRAAR